MPAWATAGGPEAGTQPCLQTQHPDKSSSAHSLPSLIALPIATPSVFSVTTSTALTETTPRALTVTTSAATGKRENKRHQQSTTNHRWARISQAQSADAACTPMGQSQNKTSC